MRRWTSTGLISKLDTVCNIMNVIDSRKNAGLVVMDGAHESLIENFILSPLTWRPVAHSEHPHLILVLRFEILQITNHFIDVDMSPAHTVVERSVPPLQVVRCAGSDVCVVIP